MTATRRVAGRAQQAAHGAWRRSVRLKWGGCSESRRFCKKPTGLARRGHKAVPLGRSRASVPWLANAEILAVAKPRGLLRWPGRHAEHRAHNADLGRAKPRDLRRCSRGAPEPGWQSRRVGVAGENERPAAQAAGAKGLAERTEATPTCRVCLGRGLNRADPWRAGSGFGACACPRPSASGGSVRPGAGLPTAAPAAFLKSVREAADF